MVAGSRRNPPLNLLLSVIVCQFISIVRINRGISDTARDKMAFAGIPVYDPACFRAIFDMCRVGDRRSAPASSCASD
jgi:hypothetical protein